MSEYMDAINAAFNLVAATFIVNQALDILKRRMVAGHTYGSCVFFAGWSGFSLFYFFGLAQWWTLAATAAMFVANLILFALVIRFRRAPGADAALLGTAAREAGSA